MTIAAARPMLPTYLPTVRAASLFGLGPIARQFQVDEVALLHQSGLSPRQLADPEGLINLKAVCLLLDALARATGRDDIGLLMAEQRRTSHLGVLGLVAALQADLRGALRVAVERRREVCSGLLLELEEKDGIAVLSLDMLIPGGAPLRQAVEQATGVLVQLIRQFLGQDWTPRRVCFRHAPPGDMRSHRRLLGWAVEFQHDFNAIVLTSQELDAAAPLQDPRLGELARQHLPAPRQHERLSETCRHHLAQLLPSGEISIDQVAKRMGLQRRTLQRRLGEEGETYNGLLQALRVELLNEYMASDRHSLARVATLLGFGSASAFSRWHQTSFGVSARAAQGRPVATP